MRNDYTRIAVVLDRSGSMEAVRAATVSGIKEFINVQQALPGTADVKLVLFDDQYEVPYDGPLSAMKHMTQEDFAPRGMTALYDAIGRTIDAVGEQLNGMPEADRPGKVIFVILTDGLENASHKYTRDSVAEMIDRQRTTFAWEFVFLGANQDAVLTGAGLNIPATSAMTYRASGAGVGNTMQSVNSYVTTMRYAAMSGSAATAAFSDKDREEALEK